MKSATALAFLFAAGALAAPALTQSAPAPSAPAASMSAAPAGSPCPGNHYAVVRTSRIKPEGSLAGFQKAMADHARWYAAHGYTRDRFTWAKVMTFDHMTGKVSPSPDMVMTFHNESSDVPPAQHDAGWDAYVAEYQANSDMLSSAIVCMQQ